MTLKNDEKSEEELTCRFKIHIHFNGLLLTKVYNVRVTLESYAKFEETVACVLENVMRNLANFYQST